MNKFINRYTLLCANIIWITVIFILCAMPGDSMPKSDFEIPHIDKVAHFGMFFILSLLLLITFKRYSSFTQRQAYLVIILITLSFGGVIEIMQHEFFSRGCELGDLIADTMGAMIACIFFPFVKRFLKI